MKRRQATASRDEGAVERTLLEIVWREEDGKRRTSWEQDRGMPQWAGGWVGGTAGDYSGRTAGFLASVGCQASAALRCLWLQKRCFLASLYGMVAVHECVETGRLVRLRRLSISDEMLMIFFLLHGYFSFNSFI